MRGEVFKEKERGKEGDGWRGQGFKRIPFHQRH